MLKSFRLQFYSCALLALSASSVAYAEEMSDSTDEVISLFERVCFENIGNLAKVSELALSEEWSIHESTNVPGKDAVRVVRCKGARFVSTERSKAWSTDRAGIDVVVAITEPNRLERPKCEIIAGVELKRQTINQVRVDQLILMLGGDGRFKKSQNQSAISIPSRYSAFYFSRDTVQSASGQREPAAAVSYSVETEGNRVLHNITLYGERMQ